MRQQRERKQECTCNRRRVKKIKGKKRDGFVLKLLKWLNELAVSMLSLRQNTIVFKEIADAFQVNFFATTDQIF